MSALRKALQAAHQARVDEYDGRIGADASLPALVADAYKPWLFYGEAGAYPIGHTTNPNLRSATPKQRETSLFPIHFSPSAVSKTPFLTGGTG